MKFKLHYICEFYTMMPVIYSESIYLEINLTWKLKEREKMNQEYEHCTLTQMDFQIPRNILNKIQSIQPLGSSF